MPLKTNFLLAFRYIVLRNEILIKFFKIYTVISTRTRQISRVLCPLAQTWRTRPQLIKSSYLAGQRDFFGIEGSIRCRDL